VSQMDEVTQQNAALVEEAAAAAESLQEQAQSLVRSVAVFRLAEGERGLRAVRREPTAPTERPRRDGRTAAPRLPSSLDDEWHEF